MRKLVVTILVILFVGYGLAWLMARRSPGTGDKAWQTAIEKNGWSKSIDLSGTSLHYLETGSGPPVLLLHGFGDSVYSWRDNIQALAEAGFRVLALDLPGMGRSEAPSGFEFTPEEMVGTIMAFLDAKGLDKVRLVGNSLGGNLALQLAFRHPERVEKIVAVDPACYQDLSISFFSRAARNRFLVFLTKPLIGPLVIHQEFKRCYHRPERLTDPNLSQVAQGLNRSDWLSNMAKVLGRFFQTAFDQAEARYRTITSPTLLIWGETDRMVDTDTYAVRLRQNIPGSRLVLIKEAGHLPHQEQAQAFNELVIPFLK